MRSMLKLIFRVFKLGIKAILFVLEIFIWFLYLWWQLFFQVKDAGKAIGSVKDRMLSCPLGHMVPLSGGIYECQACGFVYQGSILQCENPECQAITPYINCPECHLSVRNPYRWGRP